MARQFDVYSKIELRGTVRFLWAKNCNPTEIHQEVCTVYGDKGPQTWKTERENNFIA